MVTDNMDEPLSYRLPQAIAETSISRWVWLSEAQFSAGSEALRCRQTISWSTVPRPTRGYRSSASVPFSPSKRKGGRSVNRAGSSGIIAVLVSDALPHEKISEEEVGEATVEYLDEVLLRDFLDRRAINFSGILQKWVDPKGQHNSVLHAAWAEKLCKVTCLTNVRSLTDRRCSMYDRAVTFDGSESHTRRDPVSIQTHDHIENLCSNMSKHAYAMSDQKCKLYSMTGYFKARHDGRIVFLWCSSVKAINEGSDESKAVMVSRAYSPVMSVPHSVDSNFDTAHTKPYVCPVSNRVCTSEEAKTFINYKMIIQEWNARFSGDTSGQENFRPSSARFRPMSADVKNPRQRPGSARRPMSARKADDSNAGDVLSAPVGASTTGQLNGQNCIPDLIKKLESVHDVELYQLLLRDATFLYKQVRVSDEVAKYFAQFAQPKEDLVRGSAKGHGLGHFLDGVRISPEEGAHTTAAIADLHNEMVSQASTAAPTRHSNRRSTSDGLTRVSLPSLSLPKPGIIKREGRAQTHRESNVRAQAAMSQHMERLNEAAKKKQRLHDLRHGTGQPVERKTTKVETKVSDWRTEGVQMNSLKALVPHVAIHALQTASNSYQPDQQASVAPKPVPPSTRPAGSQTDRPSFRRAPARAVQPDTIADEDLAKALQEAKVQHDLHKTWLHEMIEKTKCDLQLNIVRKSQNRKQRPESHGESELKSCAPTSPESTDWAHGSEQLQSDSKGKGQVANSAEIAHGREETVIEEVYEVPSDLDDEEHSDPDDYNAADTEIESDYPEDFEELSSRAPGSRSHSSAARTVSDPDELLLAKLETVTTVCGSAHKQLLGEILPELDDGEQALFLNVIGDVQAYSLD